MRNLFDQYDQPENRLSHALAVCLNEDRRLLTKFLAWMADANGLDGHRQWVWLMSGQHLVNVRSGLTFLMRACHSGRVEPSRPT